MRGFNSHISSLQGDSRVSQVSFITTHLNYIDSLNNLQRGKWLSGMNAGKRGVGAGVCPLFTRNSSF